MSSADNSFKGLSWKACFALFCLIYSAGVVYLALGNFDKVHSEYAGAAKRLQPELVEKAAFKELVSQCRTKLRRSGRASGFRYKNKGQEPDACASFSDDLLEKRKQVVLERLQVEKSRLLRKMVIFYISFAVFFIALPMGFFYLLLSFLVWLFKDIKVHR